MMLMLMSVIESVKQEPRVWKLIVPLDHCAFKPVISITF